MLRYMTDSLVALYDIRPGNGAGQFLQPRSPHRAVVNKTSTKSHQVLVEPEEGNLARLVEQVGKTDESVNVVHVQ